MTDLVRHGGGGVLVAVRVQVVSITQSAPPIPRAMLVVAGYAWEAIALALSGTLILVGHLVLGAGRELYSSTRTGGGCE